jgi:hypothetical protein
MHCGDAMSGIDGDDIKPTVDGLRSRGIGAILDYSTEADVTQATGPKEVSVLLYWTVSAMGLEWI